MKSDPNWEAINRKYRSQFPNILTLVDLILCMSPSSAQAERGFSQLKLCKSNLRNRMGQVLLNDVFAIKYLSEPMCTFEPENAVNLFNLKVTRRPSERKKKSVSHSVSEIQNVSVSQNVEVESTEIVQSDDHEIDVTELQLADKKVVEQQENQSEVENESEVERDSENEVESEDESGSSESEETVFERLMEYEIEYEN